MNFREEHGEYLITKIEADEEMEKLCTCIIERINSTYDVLPISLQAKIELQKQTEENLRRYIKLVYLSGYNDGRMDTILMFKG